MNQPSASWEDVARVRLETIERLQHELAKARAVCSEQAEDEGLWFFALTASEAYLQAALRRLHMAVEGER